MKKMTMVLLGMSVLVFGACSKSKADSSDELTQIKKEKVMTVATAPNYAPFGFHTQIAGKDKLVGADIELAQTIAKKMGVKVKWLDMSFNSVLATTQKGEADIAVSAISVTPERKKSFDFTDSYYVSPQVVVINKKNTENYTSLDSLANKKIGAQKGTIQETIVQKQIKGAQLISIEKLPNLILEVKNGSLDGVVVEKAIASSYVAQNPDLAIATVPLKSSKSNAFSIAVPKGNKALVAELNKQIKALKQAGKIEEMVDKNTQLANSIETN